MRLTIATLRRVVKGDLTIQFVPQALTSYGELELLGRYLRQIDLGARLRQAFGGLRSDYGSARIALVLLAEPGASSTAIRSATNLVASLNRPGGNVQA